MNDGAAIPAGYALRTALLPEAIRAVLFFWPQFKNSKAPVCATAHRALGSAYCASKSDAAKNKWLGEFID